MGMEIYCFYCGLVALVYLHDLVCTEIVQFYLTIVGAWGCDVAQWVEFYLVDHTWVLFELLNYFFSGDVPNIDKSVITGDNIYGNGWKLTTSDPIIMLFIHPLTSPINRRPNFNKFIIASRNQQISIARIPDTTHFRSMCSCNCHLFLLVLHLP